MRKVVLLRGPPGAGKTTAARASGLPVLLLDDERWCNTADSQAALTVLGGRRGARAVLNPSGATLRDRAAAAQLLGATDVFVVLAPPEVPKARVRGQRRDDLVRPLGGIVRRLDRFERTEGLEDFPGLPAVLAPATSQLGATSQA